MPDVRTIYVDAHEVKFKLNDPTLELRGLLQNTIGKARRASTRAIEPGTAEFVVLRQMMENLWVDGKEIQWKKKGFSEIPIIFDEDGRDPVERLLGEILRDKNTKRLLLSKPEFREVFEEYVLPEDDEVEDLDPTESQTN